MNCRCGAVMGEGDYRCPKCGRVFRIVEPGTPSQPGPVSDLSQTIVQSAPPAPGPEWRSVFMAIGVVAAIIAGLVLLVDGIPPAPVSNPASNLPAPAAPLPVPAEGVYHAAPSTVEASPSRPDDPGYQLAAMELGYRPDESNPLVPEMRSAFAELLTHVRPDDPEHVAACVYGCQADLSQNGVSESLLDVCRHLTQASPKNVRPDIKSVAAAYCVLREPHTAER